MIHPLADCQAEVPESTNIWQYCVVLPKAKIGENCNICSHCFVENGAVVGNNVTIKNGVQLWEGVIIEDNVQIGANVSFTNDCYPRAKDKEWILEKTIVKCGASIGAGSSIMCGITIGENAMIGMGGVVTHNVPAGELLYDNPARFVRKLDKNDNKIPMRGGNSHITSALLHAKVA